MQVGTGSSLSSCVLMCVHVYAPLHHVDGRTKQVLLQDEELPKLQLSY